MCLDCSEAMCSLFGVTIIEVLVGEDLCPVA
jgi:hypothetical protein